MHRFTKAAGLALALLVAAPAVSVAAVQTAAAPANASQSRTALEYQLTERIFAQLDFDKLMTEAISQSFAGQTQGLPSGWDGLMRDALVEEIQAGRPRFIAILAPVMCRGLTDAELRAGSEFVSTPLFAKLMSSVAAGREPAFTRDEERQLQRFANSPAGAGFFAKLSQLSENSITPEVEEQLMVEFVPGFFRRFAEKAEADAARRRAARDA